MKVRCWFMLLLLLPLFGQSQVLKIKSRSNHAMGGAAFAASISDTSITLQDREERIYQEIISGNIPPAYRKLIPVTDTLTVSGVVYSITYYVLPDYLAIGSDTDYFYCPLTPAMAFRIAKKLKCTLPTAKMVDQIYRQATIKLTPHPIPPNKAMTTVPVFIWHSSIIIAQRDSAYQNHTAGQLVAGNKKDVIVSNKAYDAAGNYHVVIYGWHKPDGKPIQPVYGKHLASWADYSHGIRLVQNKIWVNGKKMSIDKVLSDVKLSDLISNEGVIISQKQPLVIPTKEGS
jgi:hypothetical protein